MGKIYPCMGCVAPKRYPGCHDHCNEYKQAKEKAEEEKAAVSAKRHTEYELNCQRASAVYNGHKRRRAN